MSRLVGVAFFLASLAIAGGSFHVRTEPERVDYSSLASCISDARYHHPLDDKHQELVNALYACGIYRIPLG